MFKQQIMDVHLSHSNAAIVNKPSKLFNKIKATLSGSMTPTELVQSEVMLSVLQRLNKSLKNINIKNLVIVKINAATAYQNQEARTENDISVSEQKVIENITSIKCERLDTIELLAQGVIGPIKYIVHAQVLRNPEKNESPIKLTITGLIEELSLKSNESQDELSVRVKQFVKKNFNDLDNAKAEDAILDMHFQDVATQLKMEVKRYFPAGLNLHSRLTYQGVSGRNNSALYANGNF
jgi:hypothetical protein